MKNFLLRLLVNAAALWVAAAIVPGVALSEDALDILLVALVFGVLNALLKPVLLILSLPFLVITLGLFAFVVNAIVLMVTAALTNALEVTGFGWALLGSLVISLVVLVLESLIRED